MSDMLSRSVLNYDNVIRPGDAKCCSGSSARPGRGGGRKNEGKGAEDPIYPWSCADQPLRSSAFFLFGSGISQRGKRNAGWRLAGRKQADPGADLSL